MRFRIWENWGMAEEPQSQPVSGAPEVAKEGGRETAMPQVPPPQGAPATASKPPKMAVPRVALWKKHTIAKVKRRRVYRAIALSFAFISLAALCVISYRGGWWPLVLDWAAVIAPTLAGLAAWAMPVKQTTTRHRWSLLIGGVLLSVLIYLQQWETRIGHAQEMAKLATKEDLSKLPTVQQIGMEFRKATEEQTSKKAVSGPPPAGVHVRPSTPLKKPTTEITPTDQLTKGIDDIKHMLGSQQWGLTADQLVRLSRAVSPYASTVNGWSGGGDLITSILGNPDSNKFATALIAALRTANWNLPGGGMSLAVFTGTPEGIIFVLHSKEDADMPVLKAFAGLLKESGIPFHGEIREDVPSGQFRIIVGAKPN